MTVVVVAAPWLGAVVLGGADVTLAASVSDPFPQAAANTAPAKRKPLAV
ncbi:MAG: hypothetical protein ACR2G7_13875 [Acidimicrobiales bacterium]